MDASQGKRAWQGPPAGPAKRFNSGQGEDEDDVGLEEDPGEGCWPSISRQLGLCFEPGLRALQVACPQATVRAVRHGVALQSAGTGWRHTGAASWLPRGPSSLHQLGGGAARTGTSSCTAAHLTAGAGLDDEDVAITTEEADIAFDVGEAGRNWERPPPPRLNRAKESLGVCPQGCISAHPAGA